MSTFVSFGWFARKAPLTIACQNRGSPRKEMLFGTLKVNTVRGSSAELLVLPVLVGNKVAG